MFCAFHPMKTAVFCQVSSKSLLICLADDFEVVCHQLFDAAVVKTDLNRVSVLSHNGAITERFVSDALS